MKNILKISFLLFVACVIGFFVLTNYSKKQIPKTIYYAWFGSKEPDFVRQNVADWKRKMPGYKIKRIDETNCNVNANSFVQEAYAAKDWRFVSDWCRLEVLYKNGGVYLDTDMVLNKSIDDMLIMPLVLTWEQNNVLSGGIFAASPKHPYIERVKNYYAQINYNKDYLIPIIMTHFFELYRDTQKGYVVYSSNELMLNFGGPENRAEHLYANAAKENVKCSEFYKLYKNIFLKEHAYCLKNCDAEEATEYLIMVDNEHFYLVHKQEDGCFNIDEQKIQGSFYVEQNGYHEYLYLNYDNNKEEAYDCVFQKCTLK